MNTEKIVEQVKINMSSIQEILNNYKILEEKVNMLELKLELMKDKQEYLNNNEEDNLES